MLSVKNVSGGDSKVTIDGEVVKDKINLKKFIRDWDLGDLPYDFYYGSAVVYNNEIHILGGPTASNAVNKEYNHYKWDGSSWTKLTDLPYSFVYSSAVVYNNEIHILGSNYDPNSTDEYWYSRNHYKWDGSSWTKLSNLPQKHCKKAGAVVYNNEIHILGGYNWDDHYKWDGSSWTEVSTLPYPFRYGSAVVYNNEIHILGSSYSSTYRIYHYKYNGSSWSKVSDLPYEFYNGSAVVFENEIHILGGSCNSYYDGNIVHYKYNGSSWSEDNTLPYYFSYASAVIYNQYINMVGGSDDNSSCFFELNVTLYK